MCAYMFVRKHKDFNIIKMSKRKDELSFKDSTRRGLKITTRIGI